MTIQRTHPDPFGITIRLRPRHRGPRRARRWAVVTGPGNRLFNTGSR